MKYLVSILIACLLLSCNKNKYIPENDFNIVAYDKLDSITKVKFLDSIIKNSDYESSLYFKIAEEFYNLNDLNRANQISHTILKKAKKEKDSLSIGRAYYYIGDCYEYTYKDSAYYFYKQAEKIFTATKNYDRLAKTHFNKGYLLFYDGVYTESEIEIARALRYIKDIDNYLLEFQCLSLQGGNLEALSLYDDALEYYQEAAKKIAKFEIDDDKKFYYDVINKMDISNIYSAQNKYDLALDVINKLDLDRLKEYKPLVYAKVNCNIAYSILNLYGPKEEVKDLLNESIFYFSKHGSTNDFVYAYKYLGEYYLSLGDKKNATENLKKGFESALMTNYNIDVLNILKLLPQSDPLNFDSYHTEYLDRYQDLIDRQIKTKNKFARIEYDTRRIEDTNKSLFNTIQYGIYITIIIILLIIMFALWRIYLSNKEALNHALLKNEAEENLYSLLQEQQKLVDSTQKAEKKRIALELHDGIMNKLYSTRLNLGLLNKNSDEKSIDSRKLLIKDIQNIEAEIRAISHDLSSPTTDLMNDYKKLLYNLIETQKLISKTTYTIYISDEKKLSQLPPIIKFNIYRIVQEAILNIEKHANASEATIKFIFKTKDCLLLIQDDGIGLLSAKKTGIGLDNIKQRVKLLKGKIEIINEKGFLIKIIFPMFNKQKL